MHKLPIFFSEKLVADAQSFSPSPKKPALAVASWQKLGVPLTLIAPTPVTEDELCLAHDPEYVASLLSCETENGFGNRLPEVAASLPYTSGAFLCAAREAILNKQVAVAPVSGFHHACYANGGGFCSFNGLVVTAQVLKRDGLVTNVGILDFDEHYGNGTADIIKHLKLKKWLRHYTAGSEYSSVEQSDLFLRRVPELVEQFIDCDIILYQAGADPHIDDPLGGWLTTQQLARRDQLVFETTKTWGIPIAWNLAGGYQENFRKVLDIHDNTLKQCARIYLDDRY